MTVGAAPELPEIAAPLDAVLLLDMSHYLDDRQLTATLARCCRLLVPGGLFILRFVILPPGRRSLAWYLEDYRTRIAGRRPWYRTPDDVTQMMLTAGFIDLKLSAATNSELFWIVGRSGAVDQ